MKTLISITNYTVLIIKMKVQSLNIILSVHSTSFCRGRGWHFLLKDHSLHLSNLIYVVIDVIVISDIKVILKFYPFTFEFLCR